MLVSTTHKTLAKTMIPRPAGRLCRLIDEADLYRACHLDSRSVINSTLCFIRFLCYYRLPL
eukprot:COSAG02_NODE_740_length_17807_cov_30.958987_8_plen_61_part_00